MRLSFFAIGRAHDIFRTTNASSLRDSKKLNEQVKQDDKSNFKKKKKTENRAG